MNAQLQAVAVAYGGSVATFLTTAVPITGDTTITLQTVVAILVFGYGAFKIIRRIDKKMDAYERRQQHQWVVIRELMKELVKDRPELDRWLRSMSNFDKEENETTV